LEVTQIELDLYNRSLCGTTGDVPLTDEEASTLASQMLWFAGPRPIKIGLKGDGPVGFLVRLPGCLRRAAHTRPDFLLGWLLLLIELYGTKWFNYRSALRTTACSASCAIWGWISISSTACTSV
jgi:hypothetical protein